MAFKLLAYNLFLERLSVAPAGTFIGAVNTATLTINKPDPDVITVTSTKPANFGAAAASYSRQNPTEVSVEFNEFPPDIMAMAMLGTYATYNQAAAPAGTQAIASVAHDVWYSVPANDLTSMSITGKTEGTDYVVDLKAGLIKILSTGTIAAASSTTVNYVAPARTGTKFRAGTNSVIQARLYGDGLNLFTNKRTNFEIYQANLSPTGGLPLIGADPLAVTFSGTIVQPSGKNEEYIITDWD